MTRHAMQGIKVTDAESRQQVERLLQEERENKMELESSDAEGWQEMTPQQVADADAAQAMQQG